MTSLFTKYLPTGGALQRVSNEGARDLARETERPRGGAHDAPQDLANIVSARREVGPVRHGARVASLRKPRGAGGRKTFWSLGVFGVLTEVASVRKGAIGSKTLRYLFAKIGLDESEIVWVSDANAP